MVRSNILTYSMPLTYVEKSFEKTKFSFLNFKNGGGQNLYLALIPGTNLMNLYLGPRQGQEGVLHWINMWSFLHLSYFRILNLSSLHFAITSFNESNSFLHVCSFLLPRICLTLGLPLLLWTTMGGFVPNWRNTVHDNGNYVSFVEFLQCITLYLIH